MHEVTFIIEAEAGDGYVARAVGVSIFTEAGDLPAVYANIRDAVRCHFDVAERPSHIRLRFLHEEVIPV
jgi:hypothetical protein